MNLSPDNQREMLRQMLTIRRFEERASADYLAGRIYGVVHCYIGEEAVAVGVCTALERSDRIISTHRGHGHCIAKGADLNRMMAELYGRQAGYCKGKGGSMHIADFGIGMLGANGIVAGGIAIVTGAGLAAQMEGKGGVAVSFFGDGASNSSLFVHGDTAYCADATTDPAFRRRGLHSALLQRRITDARNAGADLVVSGAEFPSASYRNMERIGMRLMFVRALWSVVPAPA